MTSVYFCISAIMIAAVGWFQLTEMTNGTTELAVSALLGFNKGTCSFPASLSAAGFILGFFSPYWSDMVIVAAGALCFSVSYCDERTSGMLRFTISRSSKVRYSISKLICAAITSALAMLLGYLLFCLSAVILAPPLSRFNSEEITEYLRQYSSDPAVMQQNPAMVKLFLDSSITVFFALFDIVFWAWFSLAVAAISPNKYLAITITAMVYYLWEKMLFSDYSSYKDWMMLISPQKATASTADYFLSSGMTRGSATIFAVLLMLVRMMIPLTVFCVVTARRCDIGSSD